jgi:3-isopropylmalate/(R)-2-methylmalate dehydratase large subunit
MKKTLFDKVWDAHVVKQVPGDIDILYIDRHLIHEVTSPQAFDELASRDLPVFRTQNMVATADHNVPTTNQHLPIKEDLSRKQVAKLSENCEKHGIELYGLGHEHQGIVHVIGPELGLTLPGMTIVCGDSHTSTHGAFGTIAFGIGTSEVAQVMASQCLLTSKPKKMRITVNGKLEKGVTAQDVILYIIAKLSTSGGTGHFVEYAGSTFEQMSMEERMTVCNMSIEMGARGGMIAPDDTTIEYVTGRKFAPKGEELDKAVAYWKSLKTDEGATFDQEYTYDAADIHPMLTYGTNPGMGISVSDTIPVGNGKSDKALNYMGFHQGESLLGKAIDHVFIGSCTNSRIEDLRAVADFVKGKKKQGNTKVWVVPGSKQVEAQAIKEGIDKILTEVGFEFRQPGCSACLAMNEDKIPASAYCVSTSNRNFEGRQGQGARTILASPLMAAAVAISGKIVDVRDFNLN